MSSSPPAAPTHTSHLLATVAEFVLWSVLLWHQGVVETTPKLRVRWDIWCRRVTARFRRWPAGNAARFAVAVGLTSTGVLAAVGYSTSFFQGPHWPPGYQRTLATLAVTLVAPSLIVRHPSDATFSARFDCSTDCNCGSCARRKKLYFVDCCCGCQTNTGGQRCNHAPQRFHKNRTKL